MTPTITALEEREAPSLLLDFSGFSPDCKREHLPLLPTLSRIIQNVRTRVGVFGVDVIPDPTQSKTGDQTVIVGTPLLHGIGGVALLAPPGYNRPGPAFVLPKELWKGIGGGMRKKAQIVANAIVHEWAHLLGVPHSHHGRLDLMTPDAPDPRDAGRLRLFPDAVAEITASLNGQPTWTV